MDAGVNVAVAPAGSPVSDRSTVCAAPDVTAVEIVVAADDPWPTLTLAGVAAMEKSSVAVPQPGNLNEAIRVRHVSVPFAGRYWFVYQNVQSSLGSTAIMLIGPQKNPDVCDPLPLMITDSACVIAPAGSEARRPVDAMRGLIEALDSLKPAAMLPD